MRENAFVHIWDPIKNTFFLETEEKNVCSEEVGDCLYFANEQGNENER
jgi:hypothetical protein